MDPNYALRVRKYLNKLLDARFIYPIESTQWLSPLVIVLKKWANYIHVWTIKNYMPKPRRIHLCYLSWI